VCDAVVEERVLQPEGHEEKTKPRDRKCCVVGPSVHSQRVLEYYVPKPMLPGEMVVGLKLASSQTWTWYHQQTDHPEEVLRVHALE